MTYQQQPMAPPPYTTRPQPKNGMGTAALVLGVIGVLLAWIPIIGFVGFILGALAVVFGAIAVVRASKGVATNKVASYFGLGLGVLAIVASTVVFIVFASVVEQQLQKAREPLSVHVEGGQQDDKASGSAPQILRLDFGEKHTWSGGETITVSAPRDFTPSNPFMKAPDGKRYVALDVTIHNAGVDEYNVRWTRITAQHNGRAAQQSYVGGNPLPNVQLPPGGTTTFTKMYKIGEEVGKLQVSVQPNSFAAETVYFTGEF